MKPHKAVFDAVVRKDAELARGVGLHESSDNPGALALVLVDGQHRVFAVAEMWPEHAEALAADLVLAAKTARARKSGLEGRG